MFRLIPIIFFVGNVAGELIKIWDTKGVAVATRKPCIDYMKITLEKIYPGLLKDMHAELYIDPC